MRQGPGRSTIALACFLLGCQLTASAPPPPTAAVLQEAPDHARSYAPIRLPEDDLPHDVLTEWWYYTGHLWAASGRRYGFEFTVFQSVRRDQPVAYLAHFAVTDVAAGRFTYGARFTQRASIAPALVLDVDGWLLSDGDGRARIKAGLDGYALDLVLAAEKPPILHQGGIVSFGPAGDSYYYSRTRLAVSGLLWAGEDLEAVAGQAWFDHQWGDFIVPPVGGWDWFSVQLDDCRELMLTVLRAPDGTRLAAFGTFVDADGRSVDLPAEAFTVEALGSWQSPHTKVLYPSGWHVLLWDEALEVPTVELGLAPLLPDQELAFPLSSYWEGAVAVSGSADGKHVTGHGYVELVGYRASP